MRVLRLIASILILAAAAALIWDECWLPYRCNIILRSVQSRTEEAFGGGVPDNVAAMVGRDNLAALSQCRNPDSELVGYQMIVAANDRLLHRQDEALAAYRKALQYDRRPEIFLNIGIVLLEQGKRDEAIHNLELAAEFNPHVDATIREIDPKIADLVARNVAAQF